MDDAPVVFGVDGLQALIEALAARGHTVIGPTLRDGAIVHAAISSVAQLPAGVRDEQQPGSYRLGTTSDERFFGFAAAAQSWKPFLFPARRLLHRVDSDGEVHPPPSDTPSYAFLGVRACDLAAIQVHDRVLVGRVTVDERYAETRRTAFIVALACSHPGGTCFCSSMGTGPRPNAGYDIALTELLDDTGHRFLAVAGSDDGRDVLNALTPRPAASSDVDAADQVTADAVAAMGRTLDVTDIRDLLYANAEHPRWDDVASRCLSCTNCTLVCPTCFCTSVDDNTDLSGATERHMVWDSCFTADHSYLHGGAQHGSTRARYRQWLTHKFASWIDQFGTSGCVGCGRCITWCPAGIDVTEEIAAIRQAPHHDAGSAVET